MIYNLIIYKGEDPIKANAAVQFLHTAKLGQRLGLSTVQTIPSEIGDLEIIDYTFSVSPDHVYEIMAVVNVPKSPDNPTSISFELQSK